MPKARIKKALPRKGLKLKEVLPKEYVKPMMGMLNRFTQKTMGGGAEVAGYWIAIAIAIVIVLWDRPFEEMILTAKDKAALKYAVKQIRANPEVVYRETGIELSQAHLKLMETLAR